MEIILIASIISIITFLWLNLIATIAVKYDPELNSFQRNAQYILIWFLPFIGASTVLFFVYQHSPNAIPKKWIPWPFKVIIFGKPIKPIKNAGSETGYESAGDGGE